jgi:glutamate-1-semialdehyde 2,1-aminomutase
LRAAAGDLPVSVVSTTGLLTVFFAAEPPRNLRAAQACDTLAHGRFCRELLARGIYAPPSQFEAWFPSLAHREGQVEQTLEAATAAFAAVAEAS